MDENIKSLLTDIYLNSPTSNEALSIAESNLGIRFSEQYKIFMLESNGAEGSIGNSYLVIWSTEQIVQLNQGYAVNEFTPGLVYFGSDGGGMAYAFDTRLESAPIVVFPFESIQIEDAEVCANTFNDFIKYLYNRA